MMTKQTEALKMAIEALEFIKDGGFYTGEDDCIQACKEALEQPNLTYEDGFAHGYEAHRAEQALEQLAQEVKCNPHPDAPHGFMRDESHSQDRYVCECEYWTPPAQEPVAERFLMKDKGKSYWAYSDYDNSKDWQPLYTKEQI